MAKYRPIASNPATDMTAKVKGTSLLDLPNELILEIADYVSSQRCLSRLSRTNKRLHWLLSDRVLECNVREHGSSAAVWAFRTMHIAMLSRLHRYGANFYDPKTMPEEWDTLFHKAACDGNVVMLEVLIDLGVDPLRPSIRCMPLIEALASGHYVAAKFLIMFLPSLDYPVTIHGWTALHKACDMRCGEIVRYLLALGADANLKASGTGLSTFETLLGENGVDCWGFDPEVLEYRDNCFNMLTILLENGAEPDDEAYARGTTSLDHRVRWLFRNREINVCESRASKSRQKFDQRATNQEPEGNSTETLKAPSKPRARNHRSTGNDAFWGPSIPPNLSSNTMHAAWAAYNQTPAERFPPLGSQKPEETRTTGASSMKSAEVDKSAPKHSRTISLPSEGTSLTSKPKSKNIKHRKWQKLEL